MLSQVYEGSGEIMTGINGGNMYLIIAITLVALAGCAGKYREVDLPSIKTTGCVVVGR